MALPLDIQKAIQIIEQRIAILQQTKEMILREFSDEKGKWTSPFRLIENIDKEVPPLRNHDKFSEPAKESGAT